MGKLTAKQVENAKPKEKIYRLFDGYGMYLEVSPKGGKYWRIKYYFNKKEKRLRLGVYPITSLAEARERCIQAKKLLDNGQDPAEVQKLQKLERKEGYENNFENIAREWHEQNKHTWKPNHAENILKRFESKIFPIVGKRPIKDIKPNEILVAINKVLDDGNIDLARRLLQMCSKVFRYAISTGRAEFDVADPIKDALPAPKTEGRAFLKEKELPDFLKALENYERDYNGKTLTKLAFKLIVLTFVRSIELRGAKWDEFNFEKKEWRIPPERMKMDEVHIVPLSKQSIEILKEVKKVTGNNAFGYVFPSQNMPNKIMSDSTLIKLIYVMGYKGEVTVHGFRKTASTILHEEQYDSKWIETQLSHGDRNQIRATYNYAKHLPQRHEMMQWYADCIDKIKETK